MLVLWLFIGMAIGCVVGGLVAFALARAQATTEIAEWREKCAGLEKQVENEQRSLQEKLDVLNQAETMWREAIASLSAEALRLNNQSFLDLATQKLETFQQGATGDLEKRQQAIDALVRPIQESIGKFDSKIQDIEKARTEAYAGLREQVAALAQTNAQLNTETSNLVKALRSPTVRGRWGEIQLRRVVELAGMLDYCDFREQQSAQTEDGCLRPDLIVQLPGGKSVVVDAKAPIQAYLDALESTEDDIRLQLLKQHSRQVRDHIGKLAAKQYWSQFQPTPDFVVMFLPGETFFSSALQYDPGLIEYGVNEAVVVASPTTLIALLRAIAHGWRQERIAESAEMISAAARELYSRLQTMSGHFDDLRRHLDRAVDSYNKTVGSLEARVLPQARRFTELGVSTTGDLDTLQIVDREPRQLSAGMRPCGQEDSDEVDTGGGSELPPGGSAN